MSERTGELMEKLHSYQDGWHYAVVPLREERKRWCVLSLQMAQNEEYARVDTQPFAVGNDLDEVLEKAIEKIATVFGPPRKKVFPNLLEE